MILVPTALVLHFTVPVQPVAVNVALAPLHKLLLLVVILGAAGVLPVVITIGLDTLLSPHVLLQTAV